VREIIWCKERKSKMKISKEKN